MKFKLKMKEKEESELTSDKKIRNWKRMPSKFSINISNPQEMEKEKLTFLIPKCKAFKIISSKKGKISNGKKINSVKIRYT